MTGCLSESQIRLDGTTFFGIEDMEALVGRWTGGVSLSGHPFLRQHEWDHFLLRTTRIQVRTESSLRRKGQLQSIGQRSHAVQQLQRSNLHVLTGIA
jgi:hypothetical protein